MRSRVLFLALLMGCRSKPTPPPPQPDPAIAAPVVDASITDAAPPDASRPRSTQPTPSNVVDVIAVSSRVDNTTESPAALVDGNLDTAWSSKTDDLEGSWVALHVRQPVDVTAVLLTVGMTKSADLFVQNPRISEVSISWAPLLGPKDVIGPAKVIVERAVLDIESRALQRIPISVPGYGALTLTVKKLTMGTKPNWRETTISEVGLEGTSGKRLGISAFQALVGSFHPKPRGALGIVPEQRAPRGCTAVLPDRPRFYCFLGYMKLGDQASTYELVTADSTGFTSIAPLDGDGNLAYGAWLSAERNAKGARPLAEEKEIPWQGTLDLGGVTLRQRELRREHEDTRIGSWDIIDGAAEIRWPGASDFTKVFDDAIAATMPNEAHAMRIGNWLLVERSTEHASEGWYWTRAEAALCDITKKTCTVHTEREVDADAP